MSPFKKDRPPYAGSPEPNRKRQIRLPHIALYGHHVKRLVTPDLESPLPTEMQLTNPWSMAKEGKAKFDPKMPARLRRK